VQATSSSCCLDHLAPACFSKRLAGSDARTRQRAGRALICSCRALALARKSRSPPGPAPGAMTRSDGDRVRQRMIEASRSAWQAAPSSSSLGLWHSPTPRGVAAGQQRRSRSRSPTRVICFRPDGASSGQARESPALRARKRPSKGKANRWLCHRVCAGSTRN